MGSKSKTTQDVTTSNFQNQTTGGFQAGNTLDTVHLADPGETETQSLARFQEALGQVGLSAGSLGQLGGTIQGVVEQLAAQQAGLPSPKDIAGFLQGGVTPQQRQLIASQGDALTRPGIQQSRDELRDIFRGEASANLAGAAGAGFGAGGSLGANRLAASRGRGALALSSVLNNAAQTRAALPFQIGQSLSQQRQANLSALGGLAGVGGQLFGSRGQLSLGVSGQNLSNVESLRNLRLASAARSRNFNLVTGGSSSSQGGGNQFGTSVTSETPGALDIAKFGLGTAVLGGFGPFGG